MSMCLIMNKVLKMDEPIGLQYSGLILVQGRFKTINFDNKYTSIFNDGTKDNTKDNQHTKQKII